MHRVIIKEIDAATVPAFRSVLEEAMRSNGDVVELDFADVAFMDSTGLGALIDAHNELRPPGRSLRIHNPCRAVRRLFEVTGLVDWLAPVDGERDDGHEADPQQQPAP